MMSEILPGQPLQHVLPPAALTWIAARARDAGRALGRLAVLRARLGVGRQPPPEHVHADRARRRRGVRLQRRRDARARAVSRRRSATHGGQVAVYFEAAAVIVTLVLLGQVLELRARSRTERGDPRAARPGAEDGAPHRRRRHRRGRAARRTCTSAIGCACGPASRCRSTASCSKGAARVDESMVTGEPIPVEKAPGEPRHRRHGQRHRQRSSCAASASAATRCSRRSSGWSARRSAVARADSAARRHRRPAGSCRRSSLVAVVDLRRLGAGRPGAAPGARARQRGGRADHRLPVRARPGDADVDHGRHRARRASAAC